MNTGDAAKFFSQIRTRGSTRVSNTSEKSYLGRQNGVAGDSLALFSIVR